MVVTFTNKAARELKERLASLIDAQVSKRIIVGTFHSVSLRYLQRYGNNIGLARFSVADSSESRNIISKTLKKLRKDRSVECGQDKSFEDKELTAASALGHISTLKSQGITADMIESMAKGKHFPVSLSQTARRELEVVYSEYQAHLDKHNLLDFDDLIIKAIQLFRQYPSVVQTIEHVFVDEFQDTSAQQFDLMRLISRAKQSVTIVGDHDQSIYGFRAADIANFKRMKQYFPDCVEYHLKQNYRSSGAIVFAASALIEQDTARPLKNLATENNLGPQPTLRQLRNAKNEAEWLAKEVKRLLDSTGSLVELQDFAVLVRSASLTLPIEQALQRSQINYRLQNARKFLERAHIRTLVSYLKVVQDETTLSLLDIVNVPSRNFGQLSMENLQSESSRIRKNLWQTLKLVSRGSILLSKRKDAKMEQRLCALINIIEQCRDTVLNDGDLSMAHLVARLVNGLQYEDYLKKQYPEDYADRLDDVQEFKETSAILAESSDEAELPQIDGLAVADQTETALDRLLAALSLMSDAGSGTEENKQVLTISTIHSAKGLEWPVVFIPGVYHGSIPSARAMDTEQDEERRLLYVAMTRAKALLYMSYPLKNARHESVQLSSFLSHNSMAHFFDSRGPVLDLRTVQELASLIGRPLFGTASIGRSEDIYEDKSQDQLADENYDLTFINGRFLKRPKTSVPEGAEIGFSTAGNYLKTISSEEVNKMDKSSARPNTKPAKQSAQKGIKSFFAPVPALKKRTSLPLLEPALFRQDIRGEEDYKTILLSSSPEKEFANIQRIASFSSATASDRVRPIYIQSNSIDKPHMLSSDNQPVEVKKTKKRLGMSRPSIVQNRT